MNRKRFASIFLAMALIISLMPAAMATEEGIADEAGLKAALEAGGTVTLSDDITVTEKLTIPAGKTVTLNLNGKTITGMPAEAAAYAVITNQGNLTVTDGVGGGGKILCVSDLAGSTGYAVNTIVNSGALVIAAGTIENRFTGSGAQIGYAIDNNSTSYDAVLILSGGEVKVSGSAYYDGIRQFCNSQSNENSVSIGGTAKVLSVWLQNPSDGASGKNTKAVKGALSVAGGEVGAVYLEYSSNFELAVTGGTIGSVSLYDTGNTTENTFATPKFITGGVFSEDPTAYLAEGAELTQGAGLYVVGEVPAEVAAAQAGSKNFLTLESAVDAIETSGTITVLKDVVLADTLTIPAEKEVKLNLAGHDITVNSDSINLEIYGKLTIEDTVGEGVSTFRNHFVYSGGELVVNGGTIQNVAEATGGFPINLTSGGGRATINGGKVQAVNTGNYAIGVGATSELTINNGTIRGNWGCVTSSGKVTINDGEFTVTDGIGGHCLYVIAGTATIKNGVFTPYNVEKACYSAIADAEGAVINIEGGNFNHGKSVEYMLLARNGGKINVSGGTFTADPTEYLAEGYIVVDEEDGSWAVTEEPVAVTGVTLNKTSLSLRRGRTGTLTATVAPADASNKTVVWTSSNDAVASVSNGTVTAVAVGTATITATTEDGAFAASCTVKVTRPSSSSTTTTTPSTPAVTPSTPSTAPTVDSSTTTNTDGSSTTTETKSDGTKVETTTNTDGSATKTETQSDGTVIETETKADGSSATSASKSEVKENKDGSTTTTTTTTNTTTDAAGNTKTEQTVEEKVETENGSKTTTTIETKAADGTTTKSETVAETVKSADGTETTVSKNETTSSDGSKSTTTVDEAGISTTEVTVSGAAVNNAAQEETPVALPMPAVAATTTTETAPTVAVNVPARGATVEIPVAEVTGGTVAVIVHADGTEEVVRTSTVSENGVVVALEGDATIKIVDNSKAFTDVKEGSTFDDAIAFASSRELLRGTTSETFNPNGTTTHGHVATALARLAGEDIFKIQDGVAWAEENEIASGAASNETITRQDLALMLWRYAGCPASTHEGEISDMHEVAEHAEMAMRWAIENGILKGYGDKSVRPQNTASRAHLAAMMMRYCEAING